MKQPLGSKQEQFWKGSFGDEYTERNKGRNLVASNVALFSRALYRTRGVRTILELGSNVGLNLLALRQVRPELRMSAVEINAKAASVLKETLPEVDVHVGSILDFNSSDMWDCVLVKGVLIHIEPRRLPTVYRLLHDRASRYLLVCEYYSRRPTRMSYRGHRGRLFRRDFAGEMLDQFQDLVLIDYGFVYHRDENCPQDDITWFLMEKR
jgi:spore coat polysaccharide biosynthesis protein SpsF